MKLKSVLAGCTAFLLLISFRTTYAQSEINKIITETAFTMRSSVQLPGNFFVAAGEKINALFDTAHVVLYKISPAGQIVWGKRIIMNDTVLYGLQIVSSIKLTLDGGFLISGYYINSVNSKSNGFFLKTDSVANVEWCKIYGVPTENWSITDFVQAPDSNYYAAGTFEFGGNNVMTIMKTDKMGNYGWIRMAYFQTLTSFSSISLSTDQNIYLASALNGFDHSLFISKLDTSGSEIWNKSYTPPGNPYASSFKIRSIQNGGLIGVVCSSPAGSADMMKLDSTGSVLFYNLSAIDSCPLLDLYAIDMFPDEEVLFTARGFNQGQKYVFGKFDAVGNMLWCNKANIPLDRLTGISASGDRSLLYGIIPSGSLYFNVRDTSATLGCYGTSMNFNSTPQSVSVNSYSPVFNSIGVAIRNVSCNVISETIIDSILCSSTLTIPTLNRNFEVSMFPNPSSGKFSVRIAFSEADEINMRLKDMTGRLITNRNIKLKAEEPTLEMDLSFLKNGVYFMSFQAGEFSVTRKLIIY